MKRKVILGKCLCVLLLVALLTAPVAGYAGSATPSMDNTPFHFSIYVNYDWLQQSDFTWGEDPTSKYIKEMTGADIEWIIPVGDPDQKLNTYIATDSLPDVIILDRGPIATRLMNSGLLAPLDELVTNTEKYPAYTNMIPMEVLNLLKAGDGHYYATPNWYTTTEHPLGDMSIGLNMSYYQQLGAPTIASYDDLYTYLQTVKASGLKSRDEKDVIPLSIGNEGKRLLGQIPRAFGADPSGYYTDADKNILLWQKDPQYKFSYMWMNKAYRDGLIAKDVFLTKNEQIEEMLGNARYAVCYATISEMVQANLACYGSNLPENGYNPVEPPVPVGLTKDQVSMSSFKTVGWNISVVSGKAKEKERILDFINWMVSTDGQRVAMWGPPGLLYDEHDENGQPLMKHETAEQVKDLSDELAADYGMGTYHWWASTVYDTQSPQWEDPNDNEKPVWFEKHMNYSLAYTKDVSEYLQIDPDPTSEEGIILQQVTDYWEKQALPKIIMASSEAEAEAEYDKAVDAINKMGIDKVEAVWTVNYKLNLEKLQK